MDAVLARQSGNGRAWHRGALDHGLFDCGIVVAPAITAAGDDMVL
jgi:hypothetical protein